MNVDPGGDGALSDLAAIAALLEVLVIIGGGLWALYVYRRTRRGQVKVGIEGSYRLMRNWNPGRALLLVRLRIANTSSVLYWHREATATLMDARRETIPSGAVRLVPFAQADPFPPVYGDMSANPQDIQQGALFQLGISQISLEPGEHVNTEIGFVLDEDKLGLMALRVLIQGAQGRRRFSPPYWWGTFFFIDSSSPIQYEEALSRKDEQIEAR